MSRSLIVLVLLVLIVGLAAVLLSRMDTSVPATRIEKSVKAGPNAG